MKRYSPRQIAAAVLSLLVSFLIVACEEPLPPQPAPTPTPTPPPTPAPEPTPPPEPPPPDEEYGLGLTFMDVDAYRSSYILRADPVSVPSLFDLSFDTPPPGDQGQQGSCVGWAVAYAMKSYQERVERGWPLADQRHLMSPAYVYNQIRLPGGGAYFQDAFNLLVDQGAASLAAMPYDPRDFRRAPSAAARREAANYKIASFGAVERSSHDSFVREVKRHLVQRRPVIIGIWVYPDFRRLNRSNPIYDDTSGYNSGGHAIVIIGYDDARSAFKIINSWGTDWGIDGYGWIDYDASERLILEAYVVEDVIASDVNDPPAPATVPSPADATLEVASGTVEMSWTRNERTTSFDVYVGTSRELGTIDFQGNVAEPTFTAALAPGATYYWRIDARGSAGMTRGAVWSFNTSGSTQAPVAPTNPRPAHGAVGVPLDVSLSWDSGGRATSYDVFLGRAASLQASDLLRTTATRNLQPGSLVAGTRYYWRVDAKNGVGSTPSDTWSFTTAGSVPALSIADASATEGQALSFTVTLSPAASSTVTVSYRTANGTASSSSDYTSASGTLTFRAGETRKTISVRTTDDTSDESNETFTVGLLSRASGATISDASATGTIYDNDGTPPSRPSSATASSSGHFVYRRSPDKAIDGDGDTKWCANRMPAWLRVDLGATRSVASLNVDVHYHTVHGNVEVSTDGSSWTRISSFDTTASDTGSGNDDSERKTFSVGRRIRYARINFTQTDAPSSHILKACISEVTFTTSGDDGTRPSLSIADASATEGQPLSFAVTLSPAARSTVTVRYQTHSATASGSSDYTAVSGTLTFRAGETRKTISVRTTDDTRDESNETFTVRLSNASGATISDDSATGTINDNDGSLPSLSIADASATEGQPLSFAVTLSPAASSTVTVSYRTANGTASSSSDYTAVSGTLTFRAGDTRKTISVRTTDDTRDESNETFTVRLSSASGAAISDDSATGTINDNDGSLPSLSIADVSATEGRTLSFAVTLSPAASSTVTVSYRTSNGTASSSSDYTAVSGTLTFRAGDTRKTISVRTTQDARDEYDETLTVRLSSASRATISDDSATGTINDNDPLPSLSIADASSATEGQTLSFTVTLSPASGKEVVVRYSTQGGGGATASFQDYEPVSARLGFRPGETRKTISVRTIDDTIDEPNETVFVVLTSPSRATISDSRGTGTINDNDDSDHDHGDTRSTAHTLSNCGTSNGNWSINAKLTGGDNDYFKIVCDNARGTLTAYTFGSTNTYGRLLYGNGNTAERDDNSGSGSNFKVSRPGTIGTYYVRVNGSSGSTGFYGLKVEWRPYDAPGSIGRAEEISIGDPLPRYLSGSSDEDWFSFRIIGSGCSTVTIESKLEDRLSGISAFTRTDPQMTLFLSRYTRGGRILEYWSVASDDNSGTGNHFRKRVAVRHGRNFYIEVRNRNSHSGPYTLNVTRSSGPFLCIGALG